MYLFERAYVNYLDRIKRFIRKLANTGKGIWGWFWGGFGARIIEVIVRICVVLSGAVIGVLYVMYEREQGRSFSFYMIFVFLLIALYVILLMWGWKAPVQAAARALSGAVASSFVFLVSAVSVSIASVFFLGYFFILLALTGLSLLVFIPMRIGHEVWLLYRRITYQCPYDDCAYRGLPIHVCACGERYKDLMPNFYGIFHHKCKHGDKIEKLPTLDILGRSRLVRLCGRCERPLVLSSLGELPEHPIAIVGGISVGKTVFMLQALQEIERHYKAIAGSKIKIDSEEQERELKREMALMSTGQLPAKTIADVVQAVGLAMDVPKKLRCLLYLFDSPGEHFGDFKLFSRKQTTQYLKGIMLLVDPFSLAALKEHSDEHKYEIKPSESSLYENVTVLIAGVNQMLVARPEDKCDVPLAVVMSKADALPREAFPFLGELETTGNGSACRGALEKLNEGRSIRALEQKFRHVAYFTSSALGRIPSLKDVRPFEPRGVVEPLVWLLEEAKRKQL
jgi:hypothetical protein